MPKHTVHIPEQTILIDEDLLDEDPLTYRREHGRSLIMWDDDHGAFAQTKYQFNRVSD
jgi:hypothetical protein